MEQFGLIPTHAGKTPANSSTTLSNRAHPHSCGENVAVALSPSMTMGSSPLTRGKHEARTAREPGLGLIPAYAGKTRIRPCRACRSRAHPRSRGENAPGMASASWFQGSSPLMRGKPCGAGLGCPGPGLIPDHAGKTLPILSVLALVRAHPRSRGENSLPYSSIVLWKGSSPLTRGRRSRLNSVHGVLGFIPAHAGKTARSPSVPSSRTAHPRSCGENTSCPTLLSRRSVRPWKALSFASLLKVTHRASLRLQQPRGTRRR